MSDVVPTTLCYIKAKVNNEDCYLMIHKMRKNDPNKDKYLGIGGHFMEGETPDECILREIEEETGITIDQMTDLNYRGIIHFISDEYGAEDMYLYTSTYMEDPSKVLSHKCIEGELIWYPIAKVKNLPIWEGDKIMFDYLFQEKQNIALTLVYRGSELIEVR
ncbi:MAG: 8-oxo-dGTP diphosphatase [Clostridia bacterium]|nr:8-oxo-dGTP diphosphatase [Clostridia bacterium]